MVVLALVTLALGRVLLLMFSLEALATLALAKVVLALTFGELDLFLSLASLRDETLRSRSWLIKLLALALASGEWSVLDVVVWVVFE